MPEFNGPVWVLVVSQRYLLVLILASNGSLVGKHSLFEPIVRVYLLTELKFHE